MAPAGTRVAACGRVWPSQPSPWRDVRAPACRLLLDTAAAPALLRVGMHQTLDREGTGSLSPRTPSDGTRERRAGRVPPVPDTRGPPRWRYAGPVRGSCPKGLS